MIKIAHLVHPVVVHPESDLVVAQPITFESMLRAKTFTTKAIELELLSTKYYDEQNIVPEGFKRASDINRSIYDINKFQNCMQ